MERKLPESKLRNPLRNPAVKNEVKPLSTILGQLIRNAGVPARVFFGQLIQLLLQGSMKPLPLDYKPFFFVDVDFNVENGSYIWKNGPPVSLYEWVNFKDFGSSQPYVPKWIYLSVNLSHEKPVLKYKYHSDVNCVRYV